MQASNSNKDWAGLFPFSIIRNPREELHQICTLLHYMIRSAWKSLIRFLFRRAL